MIKEYLKSIAKLIIWYIILQFTIQLFDKLFDYEFSVLCEGMMSVGNVSTEKGLELFFKRLSNMRKSLNDYEQCEKTLELRKNLVNELIKSYNDFFSERKEEIKENNKLLEIAIEIEKLKKIINPPAFL